MFSPEDDEDWNEKLGKQSSWKPKYEIQKSDFDFDSLKEILISQKPFNLSSNSPLKTYQ